MDTSKQTQDILLYAQQYEEELIEHRRFFHKNPEVGLALPVTTDYIVTQLKQMGYEPTEICKSGIVAAAGGKKPGKTFLLRGDTDALPLKEETDLPYKSVNDNMHACGHDFHTAMLLGAAKILKQMEDQIQGTVKLMFQPGEEIVSGAKNMIAAGILEDPNVDGAMMIHVLSGLPIPLGKAVFFQPGPCFASVDMFDISIQGTGGHGALPDSAVDPLVAMSHIHLGIHEINSREIPPGEFLVAVTGKMSGGSAPNIIPDKAAMSGTIRTFDKDIRILAKKRITEIAKGIGNAYRCEVEVSFPFECPALINNENLSRDIQKYTAQLLGSGEVMEGTEVGFGRVPGSEDFAFVSEKVPSVAIAIGASLENNGVVYQQHHPKVMFDESVLVKGSAIYANSALQWLNNNK